jgi:cellobiose transport system substrate-binding protein
VSLAGVMAASALAVAAPAAAQEDVIDIWNFGAMGIEDQAQAWAEERGVTVNFLTKEFDPHHESLIPAFVSGQVPDIAAIEVGYSSMFRNQPQNFQDLREFGAEEIQDDYVAWRWEHGVGSDGSIIGIPTDIGGLAMCYRTDLFEAAGLPTDRDEVSAAIATWDGFIDLGTQYVEATGMPFIDGSGGTIFNVVKNQGTEKYYSAEGEPIYDSSEQIQLAWDTAVKAVEAGISANILQFTPEWNAGMGQGSFAMLACPAWMMGYIQGQAPDTAGLWDVAQVPEVGGNWGGSQLTIPAASDNKELAYELVAYLMSPEQQLVTFVNNGNMPSTVANLESPEVQALTNDFFSGAPIGQIYAASAGALEPIYEGPQERLIDREFGNGLQRIENGEQTPEEAYASVIEAVDFEVR